MFGEEEVGGFAGAWVRDRAVGAPPGGPLVEDGQGRAVEWDGSFGGEFA